MKVREKCLSQNFSVEQMSFGKSADVSSTLASNNMVYGQLQKNNYL